jgi:hypothetical protein
MHEKTYQPARPLAPVRRIGRAVNTRQGMQHIGAFNVLADMAARCGDFDQTIIDCTPALMPEVNQCRAFSATREFFNRIGQDRTLASRFQIAINLMP